MASAEEEIKDIIAYTDESGNTGNNIFDLSQPNFWTGTVFSEFDLDKYGKTEFDCLVREIGVQELHGNELGVQRLEIIANRIENLISTFNIGFIFTIIEKKHISTMKFVDTLLDSGLNKAVSPIHYGQRALRIPLAATIAVNFSQRNKEEFWNVYKNLDYLGFCKILRRVEWNIAEKCSDKRIRELLLDAITWAKNNPDQLLTHKRGELDSPNIVAFTLVMKSLYTIAKSRNYRVKRFVHDHQNQFAKYMKTVFAVFSEITFSMDTFSWITDSELVDLYDGSIEFKASDLVYGLQIVDVALWLIKRYMTGSISKEFVACRNLAEFIISRAYMNYFCLNQLCEDASRTIHEASLLPVTDAKMVAGRKRLKDIEEERWKRMLEDNLKT